MDALDTIKRQIEKSQRVRTFTNQAEEIIDDLKELRELKDLLLKTSRGTQYNLSCARLDIDKFKARLYLDYFAREQTYLMNILIQSAKACIEDLDVFEVPGAFVARDLVSRQTSEPNPKVPDIPKRLVKV